MTSLKTIFDYKSIIKVRICELRQKVLCEYFFDLSVDDIKENWPDQYNDAIEYVAQTHNITREQAKGYIASSWVFDTLEYEGQEFLLARDELLAANTSTSVDSQLAYRQEMGGWYKRLSPQSSRRGQSSHQQKYKDEDNTRAYAKVKRSGTLATGKTPEYSQPVSAYADTKPA